MQETQIKLKKIRKNAIVPIYGTEFAAGCDLHAALDEEVKILPKETKLIPTGLIMEIPKGLGGFIYARSGLSTKQGLAPANKVGVVDSDYRGEIMVALYNQSEQERIVKSGDRIAQMVFAPYFKARFKEVEELDATSRGAGGFGSTGEGKVLK